MNTWALLHQGELGPFSVHEKPIWPFGANSWNIPNSPGHHFNNQALQDSKWFAWWVLLLHFLFGLLFQSWTQLSLNLYNQSAGRDVPNPLLCLPSLFRLPLLLHDSIWF